jgi:hypothetical protein
MRNSLIYWSGRSDLNTRHPAPKSKKVVFQHFSKRLSPIHKVFAFIGYLCYLSFQNIA